MMEFVRFIAEDRSRFLGLLVLLCVVFWGLTSVVSAFRGKGEE